MPAAADAHRYVRQSQLIAPAMQQLNVAIAGCGMVGGWTAHALARCVQHLSLWDHDKVGPENLGCQAFSAPEVGSLKVEALATQLTGLPVVASAARFPTRGTAFRVGLSTPGQWAIVSAVDSMAARRDLAEWAEGQDIPLFIDCRLLGELAALVTARPLSADPPRGGSYRDYLRELPTDANVSDAPCGGEGTAYAAMWLASQVVATLNGWCRGGTPQPSVLWHVGQNITAEGGEAHAGTIEAAVPAAE